VRRKWAEEYKERSMIEEQRRNKDYSMKYLRLE
jgi:hypothetical protein